MAAVLRAEEALDRDYLEIRCKIIEIAASLDRIERGEGFEACKGDPRLGQIAAAVDALKENGTGRAESIQRIFSLPYDSQWRAKMGI